MESQTSLSPCFPINILRTNFPFIFLLLMTLFTSFFEWHMKIDDFESSFSFFSKQYLMQTVIYKSFGLI